MYIYFSSTHFNAPSLYGFSKRYNEFLLRDLNFDNKNQFLCLRIPSVFGPGMKPNYVSVVATFCNNVAKNQESKIIDGGKTIPLLHADDLLSFIDAKISNKIGKGYELVESFPDTIEITVAELFESINTIAHQNKKHNNGSRFLNRLTHIYNFYS
jgi:UDP-2-acetamido-2,6-beta-L-arabino-hexul-4-ose reductase